MPRLTKKLNGSFEMKMNGTPVTFLAFQYAGLPDGPYRIKFQTWGEGAENWSKIYDAGFDLSLEQWRHFQHDINPTEPVHYYLRSVGDKELYNLSDSVRTVVEGYAKHLGRGNSWNGYRVNGQVIKLSSIVPYVWQNSHAYLSAAESASQAMKEVNINRAMMSHSKLSNRIACIIRFEHVAQKVAVTMPYMKPVELGHLTPSQADYLEETIHRMHRLGWAYLDQEIGFGLDQFGTPRIYDLSTVRHRSETQTKRGWADWIEDDLLMIDRLRELHGLHCSKTSKLRGDLRKKRHAAIMQRFKKEKA